MSAKNAIFYSIIIMMLILGCKEEEKTEIVLKDAFANKFMIGMAMNKDQILGRDSLSLQIIKKHCNSITAENCMKSEEIQPLEGQFHFSTADSFVSFGEANKMKIIGHTLIWHSQAPEWFFTDKNGDHVSRDVMVERMRNHIITVVGRYKGRVHGWDVVNEAFLDNGSWRKSKFYEIIGEEYLELAFRFAHEADPDAELYYNDYNMSHKGKREAVIALVNSLQDKNVRVDGVGMQTHSGLTYPSITEQENSIRAFSEMNVKIMITEFDVSALPLPRNLQGADIGQKIEYEAAINPYTNGLPDSIYSIQRDVAINLYRLFMKYHANIDRVTMWGVSDNQSWKNNWPVYGRTDYPLLFDRDFKPKSIVDSITAEVRRFDLNTNNNKITLNSN